MKLLHRPSSGIATGASGQSRKGTLLLCTTLLFPACAAPSEPARAHAPQPAPLTEKPFSDPPRPASGAPEKPLRTQLEVPGHGSAVLSLPAPELGRRPVLLVAHGAGDRPEWQCDWWESALGGRAVVLCLRGSAMYPQRRDTGYYFKHHYALEREMLASIAALGREHSERIAAGPIVYAGFSQGAIMGALVVPQHPELFRGVILIEGGYEEWDVPSARRLADGKTARVLFACGQSYCAHHARQSMRWLKRGGVEARLELAPRAGHTYAGEVGERVLDAFEWVVEGDPRWK